MKIRGKLTLLAVASQSLMVAVFILTYATNAPIDTLDRENRLFQNAAQAADRLQGEANKMATMPLESQFAVYQEALKDYEKAAEALANVKNLAAINETMKQAVESVVKLKAMTEGPFKKITKSAQALISDIDALQMSRSGDPNLNSINTKTYQSDIDDQTRQVAQFHISDMIFQLRKGNDALSLTASLIKEKDALVSAEIEKIKTQNTLFLSLLMVVVFIGGTFFSLLAAQGMAKTIRLLSRTVEQVATGDFTPQLALVRRDEIGQLGQDLDRLLIMLNASLARIKTVSDRNRQMAETLQSTASESTASAVEIEANSESIRNQMLRIDTMIGSDVEAIGAMVTAINGFQGRLGLQNQEIGGAVAAVTQMLASIDSIHGIANRDRDAAQELVSESERSREVLEAVFEKVTDITESVSSIQDMASVIASVAGQTHILAMNASIEAAHAGEFGKGFAVVAEEIGRLADASALNSAEIAQTISTIVGKMEEAGSTRQEASRALNGITDRIHGVSDSISEIHANVQEMKTGSHQILAAMENLRTTSGGILEESSRIQTTTQSMDTTMDNLGRISHEVAANIDEITLGIRLISTSVRQVLEHSEQVGSLGAELAESVEVFTTRELPSEEGSSS